jgi:hypothetical protein
VVCVNVLQIPARNARERRRTPRVWLARLRARRDADTWLRVSAGRWEDHPAFAWRAAELTSVRERRVLARSLRGIVSEAKSRLPVVSASPLERRRVAPYADEIGLLAERVGDCERPVTAAGVLLLRDLLTDGGGPLYAGGDGAALRDALGRIRATLEPR